jgi:hypothetical protein
MSRTARAIAAGCVAAAMTVLPLAATAYADGPDAGTDGTRVTSDPGGAGTDGTRVTGGGAGTDGTRVT